MKRTIRFNNFARSAVTGILLFAVASRAFITTDASASAPPKPSPTTPSSSGGAPPPPPPSVLSELLDLTDALGPKVAAFNRRNADRPIRLLAKAEFRNPASQSHKDRIAGAIVREAVGRGDLTRRDGSKKTIIAASSGNTGAAMATIGTQMGYNVTIITNKACSQEKRNNIINAGGKLWMAEELPNLFPDVLTGVHCYMKQEHRISRRYPDRYFSVNQYENMDNMMAHYETTAREIWDQSHRKVSHFVMAASTGGTIMGVGKYLKERRENLRVVLADPHKSNLAGIFETARGDVDRGNAILERVQNHIEEEGGGIQVEGAGKRELTKIMKMDDQVLKYVDEAVAIHDFDAFDVCREIERRYGFRIGGSAGLNVCACRRIAERCVDEEGRGGGAVLVTMLCDDGNKYKSKIFNDKWMEANDPRGRRKWQRCPGRGE